MSEKSAISLPSQTARLTFLRAAIAAGIGCGRDQTVLDLALAETQWISFVTLALDHQVAGIVFAALSRLPAGTVPPSILTQLERHADGIMRQRVAGLAEIRRIGAALAASGNSMIPIKGPAMRQRLYGDVAAGPSRDLDLQLPAGQETAARAVLEQCGYPTVTDLTPRQARALLRLRGQDILQRKDGQFVIEPHIAVVPSNLALKIDHSAIWQRARVATADAAPLLQLSPEDEFVLLAVHGGKEEWAKLKWLADLAAFVTRNPALDWEVIRTRAKRQRLTKMIGLGSILLSEIVPHEIPLALEARRSPGLFMLRERIVSGWERPSAPENIPASIFQLSRARGLMCDTVLARAFYVIRTMVAPRAVHYRLVRLPDWLFPAYYPIKIVHDYLILPAWLLAGHLRTRTKRKVSVRPDTPPRSSPARDHSTPQR